MDLSKISTLIFDLDGTLVDTTELILHSFRESFRLARIPAPSDRELLAQIGRPLSRQMADFDPLRAEELLTLYQKAYEKSHDELARAIPGVREALEELQRRGYRLGIATSKRDFTTRQALEFFELTLFFSEVITASDTTRHKPDPDPLHEAMRRLGREPTETTYIGDSPHDLKSAHAAGVSAGAVGWSPFDREVLEAEKPDYWMSEPASLLDLFPGTAGMPT
jgi:pyrophosphatase PpaX